MSTKSTFSCLSHRVRSFVFAREANVAVTFALILVPVLAMAGAAMDYSRANSVKADLQAALDSTALILAKEADNDSASELQANAQKYFEATFNRSRTENPTITANYSKSGGSKIVLNGSVELPTDFMQILGYNRFTITSSSTAAWGTSKLRVALVLDNTGSMAGSGKLSALKSASHNLLSMLQSAATTDGDIQVAIVPFSNGVNVGTGNVSESWLDWTYYTASGGWGGYGGGWGGGYGGGWGGGGGDTSWSSGSGTWGTNNTWNGSYGSTCTWSTCWQSTGTWSGSTWGTNTSHWQGCVTDRDKDYDVLNTAPTTSIKSTLYPAVFASSCPVAMMGLSYDWTSLNALIDDMVATGTTNQTIGLAWGWQALTPGAPLDNPPTPSNTQRVIVMLTDGLNTENRWSTNQSDIDARTAKVCSNIKADGITLYTIQVNTGGDPTSTLLQNCASDSSKFFLLTNAGGIITVFNQIGTDLKQLRIAK